MANFPKAETDIMVLANNIKTGLVANEAIYPNPPVTVAALTSAITGVQTLMDQVLAARAAAEDVTADKLAMLESLITMMKKELHYAEDTVNGDDAKLKLLGWGARKDPAPTTAPGQAQELRAAEQGAGTLTLVWLAPATGGKPTSYTVQRRLKTELTWTEIAATYERTITLSGQTRGVELEYSVVATNKAGVGPVSNSVVVVL